MVLTFTPLLTALALFPLFATAQLSFPCDQVDIALRMQAATCPRLGQTPADIGQCYCRVANLFRVCEGTRSEASADLYAKQMGACARNDYAAVNALFGRSGAAQSTSAAAVAGPSNAASSTSGPATRTSSLPPAAGAPTLPPMQVITNPTATGFIPLATPTSALPDAECEQSLRTLLAAPLQKCLLGTLSDLLTSPPQSALQSAAECVCSDVLITPEFAGVLDRCPNYSETANFRTLMKECLSGDFAKVAYDMNLYVAPKGGDKIVAERPVGVSGPPLFSGAGRVSVATGVVMAWAVAVVGGVLGVWSGIP